MDITAFFDRYTSRQRLTALAVLSAAAVGITYYVTTPATVVAPVPADRHMQASAPVMPQGYQPNVITRDPFAVPPEYRIQEGGQPMPPVSPGQYPLPVGPENAKTPVKEQQPVLTGVVMAGDSRVVIMKFGADSRSYHVHDRVGPYEIMAIHNDSATLSGPDGELVCALGR